MTRLPKTRDRHGQRRAARRRSVWPAGPSRSVARRGFTLIELLVIFGIIALLSAVLVTFLAGARNRARESINSQFMNSIVMALTTYDRDMKRLPPSLLAADDDSGLSYYAGESISPYVDDQTWEGGETLALALIGPLPADADSPADTTLNHRPQTGSFEMADGKDGRGFRLFSAQGREYGPYLEVDDDRLAASPTNPTDPIDVFVLADLWHQPILYYAAKTSGQTGRMTEADDIDRIWGSMGRYDTDHNRNLMAKYLNAPAEAGRFAVNYYWSQTSPPGPDDDVREALEARMRAGKLLLVSAGADEVFGPPDAGPDTNLGTADDDPTDDIMIIGP